MKQVTVSIGKKSKLRHRAINAPELIQNTELKNTLEIQSATSSSGSAAAHAALNYLSEHTAHEAMRTQSSNATAAAAPRLVAQSICQALEAYKTLEPTELRHHDG